VGEAGIKRGLQPLHAVWLDEYHIKAAGRHASQAVQVVARCKDDAALLEEADAGARAAMRAAGAAADLDKDSGTVRGGHDEVDLAAAAPRASIIALQQLQALLLQIAQGLGFGGIARLFGVAAGARRI
jgi:hypothetical protein